VPTFERLARFDREFRRLPRELQRAFLAALPLFIEALRAKPPAFPLSLRVKRVQGSDGVWEMTFAPDGRATFAYGASRASAHGAGRRRRVLVHRRPLLEHWVKRLARFLDVDPDGIGSPATGPGPIGIDERGGDPLGDLTRA
jgi:hypothetical protein